MDEKAAESQREHGFESGTFDIEKPDRGRDECEFDDDSPEPQKATECQILAHLLPVGLDGATLPRRAPDEDVIGFA
jgi:hypothetical protein